MPVLLRTLLTALPAGANAPLTIAAVAVVYVLNQRDIEIRLSLR